MNLTHLLDTPTLLWAVAVPQHLSETAREICTRSELNPAVSVIFLMELVVKVQKGRLKLDPNPLQWWKSHVLRLGFPILPLRQTHLERLWTLPWLHRDPADRLLIAQAITEGIPIVASDNAIRQYPAEVIW